MAEQKLLQLQTKQECTAKLLKEAKEEVCTLQKQCNNPVTLYEAFQASQKFVLCFVQKTFFFQNYLCKGHLSKQCAEAATKRFSEKKMFRKFQETIANYLKFR